MSQKQTLPPSQRYQADESSDSSKSELHSQTPDTITACEECGGNIKPTNDDTEYVCTDCGLVVSEASISHEEEWRSFNNEQWHNRARASTTTAFRQDRGLSTKIGWQNKDYTGKKLSAEKRQKMQRLRKWQTRTTMGTGSDRSVNQAIAEIQRMGSALGIPKQTQKTAISFYRAAQRNDIVIGNSIEGVASGALYAAARMENNPCDLDRVVAVSRVKKSHINTCYRSLNKQLQLPISPTTPEDHFERFIKALDIKSENQVRQDAIKLLKKYQEHGNISGKSPSAVAASIIFITTFEHCPEISQAQVADISNTTPVTIRTHYQEIISDIGGEVIRNDQGNPVGVKFNNK